MRYGLVLLLVTTIGCGGSEEVNPLDAGGDAAADGDVDSGGEESCGPVPNNGEVCPGFPCYLCENQHKANCLAVCTKYECWSCREGVWGKEAVDCDPFCNCDGPVPYNRPPCPELSCAPCESQGQEGCPEICAAGECWRCDAFGWHRLPVECDSPCESPDGGLLVGS